MVPSAQLWPRRASPPCACRAQPGAEHSWPCSNGNRATAANPKAQSALPRNALLTSYSEARAGGWDVRSRAASPCWLHLQLAQTGLASWRLCVLERAPSLSRSWLPVAAHLPADSRLSSMQKQGFFAKHKMQYGLIPSRICPAEPPLVSDNSKSQAMTQHFVFH